MIGTLKKQVWLQVSLTPKEKRQPDLHKKPIKHVCQVPLNQEAFVNPAMGLPHFQYMLFKNFKLLEAIDINSNSIYESPITEMGFCKMGQYKIYRCLWLIS